MRKAASNDDRIIDSKDQLIKIIKTLQPQDDNDKSFITDSSAKKYIEKLSKGKDQRASNIRKHFQEFNPELLKILFNLLEVNPYYRLPITELLKSPIFDKIRASSLE